MNWEITDSNQLVQKINENEFKVINFCSTYLTCFTGLINIKNYTHEQINDIVDAYAYEYRLNGLLYIAGTNDVAYPEQDVNKVIVECIAESCSCSSLKHFSTVEQLKEHLLSENVPSDWIYVEGDEIYVH